MRIPAFIRISIGLAVLTCSIVLTLDLLGFVPKEESQVADARARLCEALALQSAVAVSRNDFGAVRVLLAATVRQDEEVLSAALRDSTGRLIVATRSHDQLWAENQGSRNSLTHPTIPLVKDGKPWGQLEVRFGEMEGGVIAGFWQRPTNRMVVLLGVLGFFAYLFYMKVTLKHLDPSAVIPPRVQSALDVMSEGVLLIDRHDHVVLANEAFCKRSSMHPKSVLGAKASTLGWRAPGSSEPARELPWTRVLSRAEQTARTPLSLAISSGETRTFMVNCAPIGEGDGPARGAIATFDDITELERKSVELKEALEQLEKSRDEIRMQNEELQVQAMSDPLTGISNRRSFIDWAERRFRIAREEGRPLSIIMADIDHFKLVNDQHGHSVGDQVIQRVAQELTSTMRDRESVCRYGGEEFCVMMVDTNLETATRVAERLRRTIAAHGFHTIPLSASFGVSTLSDRTERLYDLIEQADVALYASKEHGRNRVTRFDELTEQEAASVGS